MGMLARFWLGFLFAKYTCMANTMENDDLSDAVDQLYDSGMAKLKGLDGERQHVAQGLEMLKAAAQKGSSDAAFQLGEYYQSDTTGNADLAGAFEFYSMAAVKGHPEGQSALAFMYETGIGAEQDDAKATLYHYFASTGGSVASLMSLGYKHMFGLGVPKSCDTAFSYYNPAAEKVIQEAQQPQGTSRFERVRLADIEEDKAGRGREDEEIIEYYDYAASKGDTRAQLAMGHLNYWGARGLAEDFEVALSWFERAAEGGDSHAMSMLGHMYANGLAAKQENTTALEWFTKAHELGFAGAGNGLGYMYMHGMGVPQDYQKALEYFVTASEKGNAEAHFNLGAMYIDGIGVDQDNSKALQHFAVAAGEGHTMALYNLAVMHHNGLGTARSCELAVQYLKNVVERGSWVSVLQNASRSFDDEDYESALQMYTLAAEQGVEMAQSNAAWILDHGLGVGGRLVKTDEERYRLALHYFTLSAQQNNAASLLKLADYSYYGLGTDVDHEGSAAYYMQASEMRNPQAYFNLGFMHQFGLGLPQDFHLAKRFYDMTMQASETPAAQAPVLLALAGLNLAVWWSHAKTSLPTFIVESVDGTVAALGIGQPASAPVLASAEGAVLGTAEESGVGAGGGGDAAAGGEQAERAEGLWQSWSSFVSTTVSFWEQSGEWLRLALDPMTILASLGMSGSDSAGLAGVDSDTVLIVMLAVLLGVVWLRRRRAMV